jgi:hypothetical protein
MHFQEVLCELAGQAIQRRPGIDRRQSVSASVGGHENGVD